MCVRVRVRVRVNVQFTEGSNELFSELNMDLRIRELCLGTSRFGRGTPILDKCACVFTDTSYRQSPRYNK